MTSHAACCLQAERMDKMAGESVPKYMAAFDKLLGDKEYFLKQVGQVATCSGGRVRKEIDV